MKFSFILLFTFVSCIFCLAQDDDGQKKYGTINYNYSDGSLKEDFNKLKGDVRVMEQLDFKFQFDEINKLIEKVKYPSNRTAKYHFNEAGQIVFYSDYGKDFKPKRDWWYLDYANELVEKIVEYNQDGNEVKEYLFDDNKIPIAVKKDSNLFEYQIDNAGDTLVVEGESDVRKYVQTTLVEKQLNQSKIVYAYHPNGNLFTYRSYDLKNRLRWESIYNDKKDELSKTVVSYQYQEYLKDTEISVWRTIFLYDLESVDRSFLHETPIPAKETKFRISKGNNLGDGDTTYEFDEHNNVVSIQNKNGDRKISYEYEYDSQNNWIKKTEYQDGKATFETTRTFIYF